MTLPTGRILVLWDIDRTLLYAGGIDRQVYREIFCDLLGRVPRRLPDRGSGVTTPRVLRRFFAENGVVTERVEGLARSAVRLLPEYLSRHQAQLIAEGTVMPGAVEALRAVHEDPLFVSTVVTGNLRSTAQIKLEAFGLDGYLDMDLGGFASDDDSRPRLVAIAQQRAETRHGLPFTRLNTVSVGDSLEDLRTAQLGGCRILAVASGTTSARKLRAAGANVVFEDLTDTSTVVAALRELGLEQPADFTSAQRAQPVGVRPALRTPEEQPVASVGTQVVVLGTLNTDISVIGVPRLPGPDEDAFGPGLRIAAGGKARNAAEMLAKLLGPGSVAFVGRTVQDPFGLWRVPYDALREAGVDTRFITVNRQNRESDAPAIALLAVDIDGHHSSTVNVDPASSVTAADVDAAHALLEQASTHGGVLAMSLEMPGEVAGRAVLAAAMYSLRVVLDPGGWVDSARYVTGFARHLFLIKPNAREAQHLTGIKVDDFVTAGMAADVLIHQGIQNVLITDGANGAYLFGEGLREHIETPVVRSARQPDSTGCGDQVMAALCALLCDGWDVPDAARRAIRAGALQFHRTGVRPLSLYDIMAADSD